MPMDDAVTALIDRIGGKKEILSTVKHLIGSEGVGGLVEKFTKAGHGEKATSWVGTGPNTPLTGEDVVKTLGDAKVEEVAREAGISRTEAAEQLADAIPKAVDKLTPEGKLPEGEVVRELVGKP